MQQCVCLCVCMSSVYLGRLTKNDSESIVVVGVDVWTNKGQLLLAAGFRGAGDGAVEKV